MFFGFEFGEARLFVEDGATFAELAGSDDGLFDEEALLAAVDGAAANFVAGVADGGIGIKAGLLRASFGSTNFGFGLAKSGIGISRETLRVIESEEFSLSLLLGAAEAGVDRFDRWDVAVDACAFRVGASGDFVARIEMRRRKTMRVRRSLRI